MTSEVGIPRPAEPAEKTRDSRPIRVRDYRVILYALSLALDGLALMLGIGVATFFVDAEWLAPGNVALATLAVPVFLMFSIARESQSVQTLENRALGIRRAFAALLTMAISLVMVAFVVKLEDVSRLGFAVAFLASAGFLVIARMILNLVFWKVLGGTATANLLLLDGVSAVPEPAMDVVDVGRDGLWPDVSRPEMLDQLSNMVVDYDRVVVACTDEHRRSWSLFLRALDVGGEIILDTDVLQGAVTIGQCGPKDTLVLSLGPLSLFSRIQKRAFDLVFTVPLLIVLSPVFAILAIAIKVDSPGPVFFRQVRVGHGNRQFEILKFRSMRVEETDGNGRVSASRDDHRFTRLGRFIRRTSLDELPQLVNVLRGDMSLVGPRPHALGSQVGNELFWEVTEQYWLRHSLKPGITGLAQIRGYRGATSRTEDLTGRLRCDLEYVSTWSVANDLLILIKTVPVLVHRNAF